MPRINLLSAGSTDSGRIRKVNEDDFLVDDQLSLFMVADGLGGHGSGNVASSLAIETLQDEIQNGINALDEKSLQDTSQLSIVIGNAISMANKTIYEKNKEKGFADGTGMGTTLVGIYFIEGNESFISFNIGDSRLYRHKNGTLEQTTKDHSLLQEWHDMGRLGEPPAANLLNRAVGLFPDIDADMVLHTTRPKELLMLCSDGLTTMVDDADISSTLIEDDNTDPKDICLRLVENANDSGGEDNITVVAVKTL